MERRIWRAVLVSEYVEGVGVCEYIRHQKTNE